MERRIQFWLLMLACAALFASCGPSHEERWQQNFDAAVAAYKKSSFAEAESLFAAALQEAEHFSPSDPRLDTSLTKLASAYTALGRYDDARVLYERVLKMREETLGPDHVDVARTLFTMGILYDWRSRFDKSEALYKRVLAIYEKTYAANDDNVYYCLKRLAGSYRQRGLHREAEELYRRALAIRETRTRPNDEELVQDLIHLGESLVFQLKYDEAEPYYRRVVQLREQALGPDDPLVAGALENCASLLYTMGRTAEGDKLTARAQAIRTKQ